MAAPTFVDAAAGATDAGGAWSYTCQAGAAGDIYIVQILQDGSTSYNLAIAVTGSANINNLAGSAGWTWIEDTDVSAGAFGVGANVAWQALYIGRATSTSAPTISGTNSTSEDLYIRSYRFQNVSTGTTLATVIENGTGELWVEGAGTSATVADTAVTTLGPDRLALNFVAVNDDNTITAFTGETGGDWTLAVSPYAESSGTDGAIGLQKAYLYSVGNEVGGVGAAFGDNTARTRRAQSFVADGSIRGVYFTVSKAGSPTDNLIVEIQSDSGGLPSGSVLGSGSIAGSSLASGANAPFVSVEATLTASSTYWIVFQRSGAINPSNYFQLSRASSDVYASGACAIHNGSSWSSDGSNDFVFGVQPTSLASGGTIDGGSGTITDSDAWGVVGFALIGTTVAEVTYVPRNPGVHFNDPAIL